VHDCPGRSYSTRARSSRGARVTGATVERGAATRPPLVLVAEDGAIVRLDLCRLLVERAGFGACVEARDGEEAVALAREHALDLIVMDVNMPKLDGIEAARQILSERPVPIVMLTAYADEASVARAVGAGVFAYVVKPFREQDLLPAIEAARARHREFVELTESFRGQQAVEEAKALLVRREGLSTGEAFMRLLEASKQSGQPIEVIAGAVVSAFNLDGRTGKARTSS
jgi:AmiR/NasT family two-component response regulator